MSETELTALVVGAGYVAIQAVRNTGRAWHCLATADDGTVSPLTIDPKGRIHVDTDEPDQPDQPVAPTDVTQPTDQPA